MPVQDFDSRRLVGVHAERVSDVSSRDFPGHYPGEDHSWNLATFKKVREQCILAWSSMWLMTRGVFSFFGSAELEGQDSEIIKTFGGL